MMKTAKLRLCEPTQGRLPIARKSYKRVYSYCQQGSWTCGAPRASRPTPNRRFEQNFTQRKWGYIGVITNL